MGRKTNIEQAIDFSEKFSKALKYANTSVEDIYQHTTIPKSTLYRYLSAKSEPRAHDFCCICEAMGISAEEFMNL